jgi:hypothetical protein
MLGSLPKPGTIVTFRYLWAAEDTKGHDLGRKSRPCLVVQARGGSVMVAALTHHPQDHPRYIEIPKGFIRDAGLTATGPCYVVINEVNVFRWPMREGEYLKTIGFVPGRFLSQAQRLFDECHARKGVHMVDFDAMSREIVRAYKHRR